MASSAPSVQIQRAAASACRLQPSPRRQAAVPSLSPSANTGDSLPRRGAANASRRSTLLSAPPALLLLLLQTPPPALAVRDGAAVEVDPVEPFSLEDFGAEGGWTELDSGLLYKVVEEGKGDKTKGIFDRVDHFQPFPFVTVRYTAYEPSGKAFASSLAVRRDYNYQAGVRQECQDEDGAVMSMVVGEHRQFVVPLELAFKRKLFGKPVPQREALLVDVELLSLQPY
mmetsp:Transcript_16914/g.47208  ORF Transcript_16914/g.47208 Transcript_16914/m.47208 type:complete len:227 (+) Transcript_16914:39-719(+)